MGLMKTDKKNLYFQFDLHIPSNPPVHFSRKIRGRAFARLLSARTVQSTRLTTTCDDFLFAGRWDYKQRRRESAKGAGVVELEEGKGKKGGEIGRRSKEPAAKDSGGLEFFVGRPEEAEAHPQGEKLFSV